MKRWQQENSFFPSVLVGETKDGDHEKGVKTEAHHTWLRSSAAELDFWSAQAQDHRGLQVQNVTVLTTATCPQNLGSCTAGDLITTVNKTVAAPTDPTCSGPDDTIDVLITVDYDPKASSRYDLGIYIATDGGSLSGTPAGRNVSNTCVGAAAQAGGGNYPYQFVSLDSIVGGITDTCGDISSSNNAQWTVKATVRCFPIENSTLTVASCRVWEQNSNGQHRACTNLTGAGTGSKCDCSPLTLYDIQFARKCFVITVPCTIPLFQADVLTHFSVVLLFQVSE
jgi:hypothetical protein